MIVYKSCILLCTLQMWWNLQSNPSQLTLIPEGTIYGFEKPKELLCCHDNVITCRHHNPCVVATCKDTTVVGHVFRRILCFEKLLQRNL